MSQIMLKMLYQDSTHEVYKDRFPALAYRAEGRDSILDNIIQRAFQDLSNTIGGIELAMCFDIRLVSETAEISDLHITLSKGNLQRGYS